MKDMNSENEKMNAALLKVEQFILYQRPSLIEPSTLDNMMTHCQQPEEAMAYLLCAALGLHLENPVNQQFLQGWLLPNLHNLSVEDYRQVPYLSLLGDINCQVGGVKLQQKSYLPCQLFPCGDLSINSDEVLHAPLGFFRQPFQYPALLQGDREWMTLTPNEIITMTAPLENLHGHVLVYGLGLGYYVYQALCQPAVQQVTVVDNNDEILTLFRNHILPLWNKQIHNVMPFHEGGRLLLVNDDAFHHAETTHFCCSDGQQADVVFTDLWHDAGDGMPLYQHMCQLSHPYLDNIDFRYWIEPTIRYYLGKA